MLRPKWPAHLNQKLSHWWIFALLGLCLGAMMLYGFTVLIPGIVDRSISSGIASAEMDDQKKVDILLEQESFMRDVFVRIVKCFGVLLAGIVTLSYIIVGLIWEERKGYRRVIEKLQAKSETADPYREPQGKPVK